MSNKREQLLAVVEQDISADCADYSVLQGLMPQLYEQLLVRRVSRIAQLNQEIERILEVVNQRAQRRARILAAFSLSADAKGMQRLLAQLPSGSKAALEQNWQRLGQLAAQCKQLNERNGQLLAMHHEILTQLLSEQGQAGVYGFQAY